MFYLYAISNHPLKEQLLTTSIANKKKLSESWFYWINRSLTCSEVIWSLKSNAALGFWFEIKCLIGNNISIWNEHVCLFIFNLLFLCFAVNTNKTNKYVPWLVCQQHSQYIEEAPQASGFSKKRHQVEFKTWKNTNQLVPRINSVKLR